MATGSSICMSSRCLCNSLQGLAAAVATAVAAGVAGVAATAVTMVVTMAPHMAQTMTGVATVVQTEGAEVAAPAEMGMAAAVGVVAGGVVTEGAGATQRATAWTMACLEVHKWALPAVVDRLMLEEATRIDGVVAGTHLSPVLAAATAGNSSAGASTIATTAAVT